MRLLFDTTRLQQSQLHTGIQRVVRCLLDATARQLPPGAALPVTFTGSRWQAQERLAAHPLQGLGHTPPLPGREILPGAGDTLLLFDASWYLDPWPAVDMALGRGARLCAMVHDLLPLERPEWFRPGLQALFARHLAGLAERAECLFVPTTVVAGHLQTQLSRRGAACRIEVLAHGGDFCPDSLAAPALGAPLDHLCATASAAMPLYLALGTLEPRKNHACLLDAFERLWQRGSPARLVLVGNRGWQVDELLQRLDSHPELGRRLYLLNNLSDPELRELLRHASAMLYLSSDEGFGLPVLEAAMQGCPVIATDIPVLREAGGDWPTYLPADPDALFTRLESTPPVPPARPVQRKWSEVAGRLIERLSPDIRMTPAARGNRA